MISSVSILHNKKLSFFLRKIAIPFHLMFELATPLFLQFGFFSFRRVQAGGVPDGGVPPFPIPAGGVPEGWVPFISIPAGGVPEGWVPFISIPAGGVPEGWVLFIAIPVRGVPEGFTEFSSVTVAAGFD
jgi:hypothetical protein